MIFGIIRRMSTNAVSVVCEGGVCRLVDMPGAVDAAVDATNAVAESVARIAQGYMSPDQFTAFLNGEPVSAALPTSSFLLPFALVLAGLAMNLTPCVLPMIPVNLIVIGKSWRRGLLYGLGSALAYGALGVAAAIGGLAFGAIQGSPWFNAGVAVVFAWLSLALLGAFNMDFSKYRTSMPKSGGSGASPAFPLFMGALSAVLAGACVAPVLVSALLLTADLYGRGHVFALGLPFLLGVGMALPWPFLGAGLKVLPKPGAWMKNVNRIFGVAVLCFASWYGWLSFRGFMGPDVPAEGAGAGAFNATPDTFASYLSVADRPVLVDCWASWCKNCAAMERGTLADPKVREALGKFSVIRLQAEDIMALRRLPGFEKVNGLPAFAVFE